MAKENSTNLSQLSNNNENTKINNEFIESKLGAEIICNFEPVEFRCMIQDILGNEIYGNHKDELGDRTIFYCITIPGENDWVRSCPKGKKNEFMTNNGYTTSHITSQENTNTFESNSRLSFKLVNWSYPIPSDGKNRSCLIKVYDMNLVEHLRVNDIVLVNGLVEPVEFQDDSQLLTNKTNLESDQTTANNSNNNGTQLLSHSDFEPANDFPHNLVPRVHVRTLKKMNHINPLLPDIITRDNLDITALKLAKVRLATIFTQLFGGDQLAAEYLILSLISRIHRRKDISTLGQITIGLSGIKPNMKFLIDKLYEIITKITTHSHFIDMSIANLNNLRFTPKKDDTNNKMIAGTFQLPDGLYLMLNETALTEGQLTAQGTENIETLNQIIRWQRHNYDFRFHSVQIDTDLKVLVVSEGKSILAIPYDVRIDSNNPEVVESMDSACKSIDAFLTEELLNKFRYFITALKDVPEYNIPDDVQKRIQEDFIMWRSEAEASGKTLFSASDLSSYLTLARYLTISKGEVQLTTSLWEETCHMESTRQSRLLTNVKA